MLDTGLRRQEVFRMRWEHVNWQVRTIFNPFGKTRSSRRYVPMSERVMRALLGQHCGQSERLGISFEAFSMRTPDNGGKTISASLKSCRASS
jgi:integrase